MEGQADIIEGKVGQVLNLGTNDRPEVRHRKGLDLINACPVDLGSCRQSAASWMTAGWLIVAQIRED